MFDLHKTFTMFLIALLGVATLWSFVSKNNQPCRDVVVRAAAEKSSFFGTQYIFFTDDETLDGDLKLYTLQKKFPFTASVFKGELGDRPCASIASR
jgi:hypothetical protein